MIKGRTLLILIIALLMGGGAVWMTDNWIKQRLLPAENSAVKTTAIVVAALDIPFGQKIEKTHIKFMQWPDNMSTPKGALNSIEEVEGKVARQKMSEGELVLESRIVEHISGSTLSAIIQPNMRAITLRVNDVVGVAGFLLPGNRVDVLHSRKVNKRFSTSIVLENLKVLAVDQRASTEKDKPVVVRAVTLEVLPEQAEKLFKATQEGKIQLVLRNPLDTSKIAQAPQVKDKVIIEKKALIKKKAPLKKQYSTVTVIRGTNVNTFKSKL